MKLSRVAKLALGVVVVLAGIEATVLWPDTTTATVPPCVLGQCPKEIKIANNNERLTYRVGRNFSVVLDERKHDVGTLTCKSAGSDVVENVSELDDLYPYRVRRFRIINPGECLLTGDGFTATIVAVARR